MSRRTLTVLRSAVIALAVATAATACASSGDRSSDPPPAATRSTTTQAGVTDTREPAPTRPVPFSSPQLRFAPYEPPAEEPYANGKRLAGRVAQQLATFGPLATAADIAGSIDPAGGDRARLERVVAPLVDPDRRSTGEVVYVQLSGVTATTLGAMVLVRQHLEDAAGSRQLVVRVLDVRLRRTDGPWSLDQVASVGGKPAPRPANISAAAARVLDHPSIELPDTARWDIHRGWIDDRLLEALADAADRWPLAVTVLRTGHPRNVWATGRLSAHTAGLAADIYAVDGTLVLRQRADESSARKLAAAFLAAGAAQVGSPWVIPPGGRRSFTDRVHWDHVHLQQTGSRRHRRPD